MSYELTDDLRAILNKALGPKEYFGLYARESINMECELEELARAIAEPMAARIAELEAQLARSAKINEPIQDERNAEWD